VVFDVLAGAIVSLDTSSTSLEIALTVLVQQDKSGNNSYDNVIYLLMAYKSVQILWGFFFDWLDGRWLGHSLRKSEVERVALRDRAKAEGVVFRGWRPSKWAMAIVLTELFALTITAWVVSSLWYSSICVADSLKVYIVYSLGK
jgi:hypothetical protein